MNIALDPDWIIIPANRCLRSSLITVTIMEISAESVSVVEHTTQFMTTVYNLHVLKSWFSKTTHWKPVFLMCVYIYIYQIREVATIDQCV